MRAIWSGAVTFGLVNVPVKVYSATEDHDISLHQVHDADGGRIRYQRRCEVCGKIVDYAHIDKAYDDGDRTVVLTDEDLKSLPSEKSREIDVVEFVPSDQIDPIMLDKSYFLEPASASAKAYALLRRTLEETDRTAIVHFALRQKTRLGALRVRGDVLMLQSLLWDDEVREASFPALDERVSISDRELKMSEALVASFESDFEPEKFSDDYQEQLRELIEAKLEKGDAVDTGETFGEKDEDADEGAEVLDLMEALRRSVDRTRGKKDGAASKSPAKKKTAASSGSSTGSSSGASGSSGPSTSKKPAAKSSSGASSSKGAQKKRATASSSKSASSPTSASVSSKSASSKSASSSAPTEERPTRKRKSA